MDNNEVLITILSITLSVFLLAGIVLFGYLIKIARAVSRITDKAESVASSLSEASRYVRPAVLANMVAKFFRNATSNVRKQAGSKRRNNG